MSLDKCNQLSTRKILNLPIACFQLFHLAEPNQCFLLLFFVFVFLFVLFFETQSPSVTQARVQWHYLAHCKLYLLCFSCLSLPSSGDYRRVPPHLTNVLAFLVEMGFCHVSQAGLKLLASSDPPTLASQSAGITGMSPCTRLRHLTVTLSEMVSYCGVLNRVVTRADLYFNRFTLVTVWRVDHRAKGRGQDPIGGYSTYPGQG
uniref:Uncharacterized protein n=1 Tax=Papio anubis TaxID=9555 RepID=A0A8I5NBN7_PAPAN